MPASHVEKYFPGRALGVRARGLACIRISYAGGPPKSAMAKANQLHRKSGIDMFCIRARL
jgi:hypothetical protein